MNTYKFDSVKLAETSYEGRQRVQKYLKKETSITKTFSRGSVIVPINQRRARVLVDFLEPDSYDSFLKWGFFNNLFESKEYFETYIMELIAEQMLKDDKVKAEFERDKKQFPSKFIEQRDILNWFYERSPYFDTVKNVYPIGRILSQTELDAIMDATK